MKTLEEMNLTSQTDLRKIDSKVRKVKNLLDTSMEGLEEKINFPIGELSCKLETKMQENKVELESEQTALKRRFDEFENVDVVNMTRRIATARNKINDIIEKTSEIDLQIKEIHRDKSSNLLLHGLTCTVSKSSASNTDISLFSLGGRVSGEPGQDHLGHHQDQAGDGERDEPGERPQTDLHPGGGQQLPPRPHVLRARPRQGQCPGQD